MLANGIHHDLAMIVAPRVGAWIETLYPKRLCALPVMSHPVWVRGLKLILV